MDNKYSEFLKKNPKPKISEKIDISKLSDDEVVEFIQMLEVYQIELELQNEELKAAQKNIEKVSNKYFALFEFAPVGYIYLEADYRITDSNFSFSNICEFDKAEIVQKSFTDFIAPEFQDTFHLAYQNLLQTNNKQSVEIQILTKNNLKTWVDIEMITYDEGKSCFISIHNKNEKKIAEQALSAQQKELKELNSTKDKLFSIIGHDLKSPMGHIISFANLLQTKFDFYDDTKKKHFIDIINQSANSTLLLLENLLEWAQSQTKRKKITVKALELNGLVETAIRLLSHTAVQKNIKIANKLHGSIFVFGDEDMLKTVVRNLISNALKYSNTNSYIEIEALQNDNICVVSVKDFGKGMDTETQGNLFKTGLIQSKVGTNGERGTALGLLICKDFVEQNNGEIWFESEVDLGSTFYFSIPLVTKELPEAKDTQNIKY